MPNLFTVPAGESIARLTAEHALRAYSPELLARAVIFVPTRRSCQQLRTAFQQALQGKAALLPRMVPLADIDTQLLGLLGDRALPILDQVPPAMPRTQHRYILTQQVAAFERRRMGSVTMDYALTLADALMALQENCARAEIAMTQEALRACLYADVAEHWKEALLFLGILTDTWPKIEQAYGMTIAATREVQLLHALADAWAMSQPDAPVIAVGSTASQPATARLLKTIADMPNGAVIVPGIDPAMDTDMWQAVAPGHPLFHVKQFIDQWPIPLHNIKGLAPSPCHSIWLEALAPSVFIPQWPTRPLPPYAHVRMIPCAHAEEEVRVISLLLREALESPTAHAALITPDEGLMARVATHMKRYGIVVDYLHAGTLAATETGSLWASLIAAIAAPDRLLRLRELLHHPLLGIDAALLAGLEKGWHGVNRRRAGQLPRHDASLATHPDYEVLAQWVGQIAGLKSASMTAPAWRDACAALLAAWVKTSGQAHDAVMESLDALEHAEGLGHLSVADIEAIITERLSAKWRDGGLHSHPRLHLLTPVEARLQQFDRVILANMQDAQWPGSTPINPWMNLAAEKTLGLPPPEERISLMAHDMLMLATRGDVFLTYPLRDAGSPTTRSRFVERLVTLLASHKVEEEAIHASSYRAWASMVDASRDYAPEAAVSPRPRTAERPHRLPVTDIDTLFIDPFSIYAKHVLGLRKLDDIDANPEANDFGSLTHRAVEGLSTHWSEQGRAASEAELVAIADKALHHLSERPNIDIFWRARLMGGLRYVNALEESRRPEGMAVACEQTHEAQLALDHGAAITLHGRIDRIETTAAGATLIDYKTGTVPTEKSIVEGRALQLMAYAMLLQPTQPVTRIEYWQLPRLGDVGSTLCVSTQGTLPDLEAKLKTALAQMLDEQTPFLARPVPNPSGDRFGNDYDGISRYDEWSG